MAREFARALRPTGSVPRGLSLPKQILAALALHNPWVRAISAGDALLTVRDVAAILRVCRDSEFERYLGGGILANGFARVHCTACGDELLVAFSCKGRGFCPSCTGRRMHDIATNLVNHVIPHVPVRQWVLSLPRWARFLLARDPMLITCSLDIALRTIFAHQRRVARRAGALA